MGIEVNIDADAINDAVTKAVVESVIGDQMKAAIEATLKPNSYGRQSAIENVVAQEVQKAIREVIQNEYADQIKGLQKVIGASTAALLDKLDELGRSR